MTDDGNVKDVGKELAFDLEGSDVPLIDSDGDSRNQQDRSSGTDSTSQKWRDVHQLLTIPDSDNQYQLTVKSFASIGLGVSNGRKIVVRKFDTTHEDSPNDTEVQFMENSDAISALSSSTGSIWWKAKSYSRAARMEFFLSFVGLASGLANTWRFPWLCYKHNGGAFLVSYIALLFLCSFPVMVLELAIGQFTRSGPVGSLRKLCPFAKGIGLSSVIVSFIMSIQYAVIESYSFQYLYFGFKLPQICQNATNCHSGTNLGEQSVFLSASGTGSYALYGWLLVTWFSVFMFEWRLFRSNGRSYYFTATLPVIIMVSFMTLSLTLDGAGVGVRRLFTVEWSRLGGLEIWIDSLSQCLNMLALTYGAVIVAGSCNRFTSEITHSCMFITIVNGFMSIASAITVFAAAGSLTYMHKDYILQGPGLVLQVYSFMVEKLPLSQIGALVFGSLILLSGLNTQMLLIEVVVMFFQSALPTPVRKVLRYREILSLVLCTVSFGLGCAFVFTGEWLVIRLIDNYIATKAVMILLLFEIITVAWVYGSRRLSRNLREMTRRFPSVFYRASWTVIVPVLAAMGVAFTSVVYYGDFDRTSEVHANFIFGGWILLILVLIPVPSTAFWIFLNSKGTGIKEKLVNCFTSEIDECSCCHRGFTCLRDTQSTLQLNRAASAPQLNAAAEAAKRYFSHTMFDPHVTVTGTNITLPVRTLITNPQIFEVPKPLITDPQIFEPPKSNDKIEKSSSSSNLAR